MKCDNFKVTHVCLLFVGQKFRSSECSDCGCCHCYDSEDEDFTDEELDDDIEEGYTVGSIFVSNALYRCWPNFALFFS